MPDAVERKPYIIEIFNDSSDFISFDRKKNQDSAEIAAEVTAKSRKQWLRVVHQGQIIASYDYREKD
ncbi:MAG: hypothetical protein ABFD76_05225 [Smithella sp.]